MTCCQGLAALCQRCNKQVCLDCSKPLVRELESVKTAAGRFCTDNWRCQREKRIEEGLERQPVPALTFRSIDSDRVRCTVTDSAGRLTVEDEDLT